MAGSPVRLRLRGSVTRPPGGLVACLTNRKRVEFWHFASNACSLVAPRLLLGCRVQVPRSCLLVAWTIWFVAFFFPESRFGLDGFVLVVFAQS